MNQLHLLLIDSIPAEMIRFVAEDYISFVKFYVLVVLATKTNNARETTTLALFSLIATTPEIK